MSDILLKLSPLRFYIRPLTMTELKRVNICWTQGRMLMRMLLCPIFLYPKIESHVGKPLQ